MKEIQLSERMIPRTVCRSGSFNRRTTSRPILSIQLNDCVRFKLQDSSSDSQSNLDQRKEERELQADQALLGQLSLHNITTTRISIPSRLFNVDLLWIECMFAVLTGIGNAHLDRSKKRDRKLVD